MNNRENLKEVSAYLAVQEPVIHYLLMNSQLGNNGPYSSGSFSGRLFDLRVDQKGFILNYKKETITGVNAKILAFWIIREYLFILLGHHKADLSGPHDVLNRRLKAQELAINSIMNEFYELPDALDYYKEKYFPIPTDYNLPELQTADFYYVEWEKNKFPYPYAKINQPSCCRNFTGTIDGVVPPKETDLTEKHLTKLLADFYAHNPNHNPTQLFSATGHDLSSVKVKEAPPPEIDWRLEMKYFTDKAISRDKLSSYKSYSRRLGFPFPAKYQRKIPEIAVLVDTSASNLKNFPQAIGIIKDLSRNAKVEVYQADTAITKISNDGWYADFFEFAGLGGTDLGPALEKIFETGFTHIIVLTDGQFKIPELENILWVLFQEKEEPKILRS